MTQPPQMPQSIRRISRRRARCRLEEHAPGAAGEDRLHPLLRRIFENRNVRSRGELDYALENLHSPQSLKGIDAATAILHRALSAQHKILVVGDYDADGATAASVALLGLRAFGATDTEYLVPDRFEHGYGLSEAIARLALRRQPQVVITVDNGISSIDGVALLRAAGVEVVITDHHLAGAQLPRACAIVNPNQPGCEFPSKALAGVGVMFYLLLALRARLRAAGWFNRARRAAAGGQPNLAELLDLVALGTVADLVPLDHNNRILVAQGMMRIRSGRCRPGLKALAEIAGRRCEHLEASDLGFIIAPRLNAAGRMEHMSSGIECLLADNPGRAGRYAEALEHMNARRHQVQTTMLRQAERMVCEHLENGRDCDQAGLCLFDSTWHQGITGLVASRVKDRLHRPVVAFAPADDGRLRGSARSVADLHIRDLLESISTRHPGLIEQFGGHAMAAGLTIEARRLEAFSDCFSQWVDAHFNGRLPDGEILTDGELAGEELTLETAELVRAASPWGQHFPAPVFDGEFRVTGQRVVGERHLKMVLERIDGSAPLDAIVFRHLEPGQEAPRLDTVKAAYQLKVNRYRGRRSLQLVVEYMQPC